MEDVGNLSWYLETVCTPVITVIGLTGNILTLIVLSRWFSASTHLVPPSMRFFLMALAVTDSLILLLPCFTVWIVYATSGLVVYDLSDTFCRLGLFMVYFLPQLSPWLLCFITIERVLVVIFPMSVKWNLFTFKNAISLFAITVFLLTLMNAHFFFRFDLIIKNVTNKNNESTPNMTLQARCYCKEEHVYFMYHVWSWIDFVFASGIPFLALFIGNSLIIKALVSQERFRGTSAHSAKACRRISQSKRWAMVSVLLGLAFVLLAMPIGVYQIGQTFWFPAKIDKATQKILELVKVILHLLLYTNSAINFVLYMCSSSKHRKYFMKLIRNCSFTLCKCTRQDNKGRLQIADTGTTLL